MQREGDAALFASACDKLRSGELIFESHMDLWVTCKKCHKVHHTSLFMSDYEKWKETKTFPDYLSDNGRSLLTTGICQPCTTTT